MAEENPNVVCDEFNRLLQRSNELFTGLRDLPRFGVKQWQAQFLKTFDIYTKLWKFQQEKRFILEEHVNLKRHQIGEIASKVGQLYYHYYLHTSDVKYLSESLQFYSAINKRSYFTPLDTNDFDASMAIKSLRYLARFFVVSLLVRDYTLMDDLIQKLQEQSQNLAVMHHGDKNIEDWTSVVKEAKSFIMCENFLTIHSIKPEALELRLKLSGDWQCSKDQDLKLQSAVVIGGCEKQVKFSELTLDMYRMLLLLEYHIDKENPQPGSMIKNPAKFMLYKPNFQQLYAYLAAVFKDLQEGRVMIIYISGDSNGTTKPSDMYEAYSCGISTVNTSTSLKPKSPSHNPSLLYPDDLISFTRRPLFLIIDACNSHIFHSIQDTFNQPLFCLMSPSKMAEQNKKRGSLFTLFLLDPLLGICQLCRLTQIARDKWKKCKDIIKKICTQSLHALAEESTSKGSCIIRYLGDDILRNIISNYLITWMVSRTFRTTEDMPSCKPTISKDVLESKVFLRYLMEVMEILNVRSMFREISDLPPLQLI